MVEYRNLSQFLNAGNTSINNLILQNYQSTGMTNDEFLVFLQIKSMQDATLEPSTEAIGKYLNLEAKTVFQKIEQMQYKGLATFVNKRDSEGRVTTFINFEPFYTKILNAPDKSTEIKEVSSHINESKAAIYSLIEQEFGRQLTPIELETIRNWFEIDHFIPELIQLAVQEAVLNQALSLKYIETILFNWQKKNYRSVREVKNNQQRGQQKHQLEQTTSKSIIPLDVDINHTDWSQY